MYMQIVTARQEMATLTTKLKAQGKTIGFVPTMGFLHEGHVSLVRKARAENDVVVVSIFVNPAQFGPTEDFAQYPRDFEHDKVLLEGDVDYLFHPSVEEMYRGKEHVTFQIKELTECLCGISRPHHFPGVALVVAKFFQLIQPDATYFGQKDFQQTVVVKHLIEELFFKTRLVVCPIVREVDGLALSSRNIYLKEEERAQAVILWQALRVAESMLQQGEKRADLIIQKMKEVIESKPLARIDYVDMREAASLKKIDMVTDQMVVVAVAAYLGKTRLIDNILFTSV